MNIVRIIRDNKILNQIYEKSTSLVEIVPYYVVEEYFSDDFNLNVDLEDIETGLLEPSDIKTIAAHSEVPQSDEYLNNRIAQGCICMAVKSKGSICAYSWCNLQNFAYCSIIPLKDNEAYLFDARTFSSYRGKNVAPYVRHQLYTHLTKMGRTRFISATSFFNTSAMKFKVKLGAKPVELRIYIKLFKKYSWDIPLKKDIT